MPPSKIPYKTFIQNRTKKSVALDLKKPEAKEVLQKLAATSDVFLTNSPLRVQQHLKHTYEDISAINPKVVYAWIDRFGQAGPDKDAPGFDMTAWYARTGMMEELHPKDGNTVPLPVRASSRPRTTEFGYLPGRFARSRSI